MMIEKISTPADEAQVRQWVKEGEAWSQGFYNEALDMFKLSGASDPSMPIELEGLVEEFTRPFLLNEYSDYKTRRGLDKRSSAPGRLYGEE